jgi:hypothetical protein
MVWVESRAPHGVQPKSWAPHVRRPRSVKRAMEVLRKVGRSDRSGWRSDCQALFRGWSDCLGSRSDASPCSAGGLTAWAHNLTASLCSGHGLTAQMCDLTASSGQRWKAWWNVVRRQWCEHGSRNGESSCRKMSKSLVRRGEAEKGKSTSSKTTCQKTTTLLLVRSRH